MLGSFADEMEKTFRSELSSLDTTLDTKVRKKTIKMYWVRVHSSSLLLSEEQSITWIYLGFNQDCSLLLVC